MNRTNIILKNYVSKIIFQIFSLIANIYIRKLFLKHIGPEYLGLNSLITSLIVSLNIFELGIGDAIYTLLIPEFANKNEKEIASITNYIKKMYLFIGIAIIIIGSILSLFIYSFIKTNIQNEIVLLTYFLMLFDTAFTYFLSYRRILFNADQKEYFINNVEGIVNLMFIVPQIIIIFYFENFMYYLILIIISKLLINLVIFIKSHIQFGFLRKYKDLKIQNDMLIRINKNIRAIFLSKIGLYIIYNTDNILLSSYFGLVIVGLLAIYNQIIFIFNNVFSDFIFRTKASIGNFAYTENKENTFKILEISNFIHFVLLGISTLVMAISLNDFILWFFGDNYLVPETVVYVIIFNNYFRTILNSVGVFKEAVGLYNPFPKFKYYILIEALLNLFLSIYFISILKIGYIGIFLGTTISSILSTYLNPFVIYKIWFNKTVILYFKKYFINLFILVISFLVSKLIIFTLKMNVSFFALAFQSILITLIFVSITFLVYYDSHEIKYLKNEALKFITGFKAKSKSL